MIFLSHRDKHSTVRTKFFGYGAFQKFNRINPAIRSAEAKTGDTSEDVVERILKELKEQGKIRHFFRTKNYDRLDRMGIDFMVTLWDGDKTAIQVKGSEMGIRKFEKQREEHNYKNALGVPVFVVKVVPEHIVHPEFLEARILKELEISGAE